jgi:hypothetical protein
MNVKTHFRSCFCFWRPSMARRITVYFVVFGLIVFYASTLIYMIATKKHFIDSAQRLVRHQLNMVAGSREADFLWSQSGSDQPGLYDMTRTLKALSSILYTVQDIAFYGQSDKGNEWYRFEIGPDKVLSKRPVSVEQAQSLPRGMGGVRVLPVQTNPGSVF